MDEQKYSKCAIASFGLMIFSIVLFSSSFYMLGAMMWFLFIPEIVFLLLIVSLILAGRGLGFIKKESLRGKLYAILSLTISGLILVLLVAYFAFESIKIK